MHPFDPETGAVGVTGVVQPRADRARRPGEQLSDAEGARHSSGSLGAQMPWWPDAVTEDELATIERWIAEGALDN